MSKFFVFALVLVAACLCYVAAMPTPEEILDAHTAIQKIIAAYERYPGKSVHHPAEIATLIDPNTFYPNIKH